MIVLFYGGRDFTDYKALCEAMKLLPFQVKYGVQGGAKGADAMGARWCAENNIHCAEVKALWDGFGKSAGFKRNFAMADMIRINYAVEMPGGAGTASMRSILEKKNIPVYRPYG